MQTLDLGLRQLQAAETFLCTIQDHDTGDKTEFRNSKVQTHRLQCSELRLRRALDSSEKFPLVPANSILRVVGIITPAALAELCRSDKA